MRKAYKVWTGIAAGVFVIVAISDLSGASEDRSPSSASTRAATSSSVPAVPAAAAPTTVAAPAGDAVTVTHVVDGDTFRTSDGGTVQVIGIDACEPGTYGGDEATRHARSTLEGRQVTLTREPGIELDRHGNDLRYVETPGGDFAESAVIYDHTTVYDGHGAPAAYLAELRSRDYGGQVCAAPAPGPAGTYSSDGDGNVDWPTPGDQGLPDGLLTGGYCARKWWC